MDNTKVLLYRHQTEEEGGHGHGQQAGGGEEGDAEEGQDDGDDEAQREVVFCLRCLPRSTGQERKPWTRKVDMKESLRRGLENWLSWLMEQIGEVGAGE